MNNLYKPPLKPIYIPSHKTLFLGGSIDQGTVINWQDDLTYQLMKRFEALTIFNPRREQWDDTWVQSLDNPHFEEQVSWEVEQLEKSDWIFLYFHPGTLSPISLLELGLFASSRKIIVSCPDGFWRKGNVDFITRKFKIPTLSSYLELPNFLVAQGLR